MKTVSVFLVVFMFIVESETNNDVVIEQTLERFSRSSSSVKKTWSYICAFNCVSDSKTRMDPILSHDLNPSNYEGEQVRRIETCKIFKHATRCMDNCPDSEVKEEYNFRKLYQKHCL